MIVNLTAEELRKLAEQVDAYTALARAGAEHHGVNTVLSVDGRSLAYLSWWEDRNMHAAQIISFVPQSATPLSYHESASFKMTNRGLPDLPKRLQGTHSWPDFYELREPTSWSHDAFKAWARRNDPLQAERFEWEDALTTMQTIAEGTFKIND